MNIQLSLFEQEFRSDTRIADSPNKIVLFPNTPIQNTATMDEETGEGITWVYSTDRMVKRKDGTCKVIPAKLTKEGVPKKVPLNYKKGGKQEVYPIKNLDEVDKVSEWLLRKDPMSFLCFTLGFNLGLRGNELLSLRYRHILNQDGSIRYQPGDEVDTTDLISVYQKKVRTHREVYLNDACVNAIRMILPVDKKNMYSDDFIFLSREASSKLAKARALMSDADEKDFEELKAKSVGALRNTIKKAGAACGIKQNLGTHSMRKSFGYFHYKENGDIAFLQELFGHSSQLMTLRYIGILSEDRKKAYQSVSIDTTQRLIDKGVIVRNGNSFSFV